MIVGMGFCVLTSEAQVMQALDRSYGLQLDFRRQNNFTYLTRLDLLYNIEKEKYRMLIRFHHDNLYNSRRNSQPFVQVFFNTEVWQYFKVNPSWEVTSLIESDQFLNTRNQRYSVYLGGTYKRDDFLEVTPLIGYSWDYRSRILDQGISPAIQVRSQYKFPDGLSMRTYLMAKAKYISPRHQRNIAFETEWAKTFNDDAGVALGLRVGSNEMDDYKSNSIEKIKADTISAELGLRYPIMPGVFWQSDNELIVSRRNFDYEPFQIPESESNDLIFNQLNIFSRQRVSFGNERLQGYFSYTYQFLGRRYELDNSTDLPDPEFQRLLSREEQKDYFRNLSNLELKVSYQFTKIHQLALTATNRYLQYDTPSSDNFDDHDELNYRVSGELKSQWSRQFSTRYKLIGSVRQYAFLFKERSQDNYTQRSLRMEFEYKWELTRKLVMRGRQYIYVTYNVKDFPDINRTDRSTRNLESRLEIDYRPKRKWEVETDFYRKEIHVSYLNWDKFTETTLDTTTTYTATHTHRIQLSNKWKQARIFAVLGYKHFSQFRLLNTSMTSLQNLLTPINLHIRSHQTGFVTGLRFLHRHPATLEASVWWQVQYQDFKFKEIPQLTSLSTNYREENLIEPLVNFRPFVHLQLNWQLGKR